MERKLMLVNMYSKTPTMRTWTTTPSEGVRPVNGGHSIGIDQKGWSKQQVKWNHSEVTHHVGWMLSATRGWATAAKAWKGDKHWHTKKMPSRRKSFQEQLSLPLIKLDRPALLSRRCLFYLWGNPTHTFLLHNCSAGWLRGWGDAVDCALWHVTNISNARRANRSISPLQRSPAPSS